MPDTEQNNDLVSCKWLADHLTAPDIRVVDASWHMPGSGRNARLEYAQTHIPGAVFFDIDEISEPNTPCPHMLPSPEKFASRMRALGLGDGCRIIIYDNSDVHSAARAWWMFRTFGYKDVAVLDGGLAKWRADGQKVEDISPHPGDRHFTVRFDTTKIRNVDQIRTNLDHAREQILDARSPARFAGEEAEPRPGVRPGHIPNSFNLHYAQIFTPHGTMKSPEELTALFNAAGIDLKKPIITSCGSGITACVLALALHQLGHQETAVYDGSWAEWGARTDLPLATGRAHI